MSRPPFVLSWFTLLLAITTFAGPAFAAGTPRPPDAEVYIISPADGATVTSPFVVQFGLRGMGVAPAGIEKPNTGHHHLFVDVDQFPDPALPMPSDANHIHFGGGQTETTLDLAPGKHTLQLVFGDAKHMMFEPKMVSKKITITVVK